MTHITPSKIYGIPIIGNFARIIGAVIKLPSNMDYIKPKVDDVAQRLAAIETSSKTQEQLLMENSSQLRHINNKLSSLENIKLSSGTSRGALRDKYFADNHLLDDFYVEFENKFRGDEQLIISRLEEYLPIFASIKSLSHQKPVLDIGCGRGELLTLLKSKDINAIGIDINQAMVKACNDKGLKAVAGDASKYLSDANPESFVAITGFHIIEHIEFSDLLKLFTVAYKALDDKGFVLFETPNPKNVYVGANTFYYDPSHLKPLPPELIQFALETVGFRKIEIKYLHEEKEINSTNEINREIQKRLFGPRDYAVIASK